MSSSNEATVVGMYGTRHVFLHIWSGTGVNLEIILGGGGEALKGSSRLLSVSSRDCHDTLYPPGGGNTVVVVARAAGRAAMSASVFMMRLRRISA
jgi:hypothetical protein